MVTTCDIWHWLKILRTTFRIKTMFQELFPSFQTKVLANGYCLSDLFEGVPVKEQALDHIKQWDFYAKKKNLKSETGRHRQEKDIQWCQLLSALCPWTSYHQASFFIYKIKPQMPPLQIVARIQEDAKKTLDTVPATW